MTDLAGVVSIRGDCYDPDPLIVRTASPDRLRRALRATPGHFEERTTMFDAVDPSVDLPELDLEILEFWRQADIAKRSFEKDGGAGHYTFYEGPPTANGKPGLHHASTRSFKDLVLRYKTMRGYKVGRRGGWDTHGLPVEVEIEKEIGSTGKKDIEAYGIAKFNERCRDSVFRYIKDWNDLTERIGFWLDLENAYITYENGFIESCWWILKELWDRDLLFEDYKITMHCPRCNTSLADHEAAQGMKPDAVDPSVWVKFPAHRDVLVERGWLPADDARTASLMIWTTTPWTLPANSGIAIKPEGTYALVEGAPAHGREGDPELYIVGEKLLDAVFEEGNYRVLASIPGTELVGLGYDPIIQGRVPAGTDLTNAHRVVPEASVELEEGTGLVHIAPAYGDLEIGRKNDVPTLFSVDLDGTIFPEVELPGEGAPSIVGEFFKDADKPIMKALDRAG
ncbi:MAG: class I tRNA ligase family protein [Acidobacteriota bacterium]